jgi:hypothetical protein
VWEKYGFLCKTAAEKSWKKWRIVKNCMKNGTMRGKEEIPGWSR